MNQPQEDSIRTRLATFANRAAVVFCFALAFALASTVIEWLLPFPDLSVVKPKLDHFATHGDEYDVLFIGSSRVYHQIVPAVFDREMAALGHPLKSFNAGIAGMFPPEDSYVLEQFLRCSHRRLRWVFVETGPVLLVMKADLGRHERLVYWHDWTRLVTLTKCAVRRIALSLRAPAHSWIQRLSNCEQPLRDWLRHLELTLERVCHLGRGLAGGTLFEKSPRKEHAAEPLGPNGDGWVYIENRQVMPPDIAAEYAGDYAQRLQTPAAPTRKDFVSDGALRGMAATIEQAGAASVFLVSPTLGSDRTRAEGVYLPPPSLQKRCATLDFSDVHRYPELFEPKARFDQAHVNSAGAELYSRRIAERFAEVLAAKHPPRPSAAGGVQRQ